MNEKIIYEDLLLIEKKYKKSGDQTDSIGHQIIKGDPKSKVIISCPHSVTQTRNGVKKARELFLPSIALLVQKFTNCHLIIKTSNLNDDANYDVESKYKNDLKDFVLKNDIKMVIDIHGMRSFIESVIIGTGYGKTINYDQDVLKKLYNCFLDNKITSILYDKKLVAAGNTITTFVNKNTNALAVQLEIGKNHRQPKTSMTGFENIIKSLCEIVIAFDVDNKYYLENVPDKSHFSVYDEILDFKTKSMLYENVPNSHIGMEIEMGINYNRGEYTFISKHLKKLKSIVGEEGEFYKDFTVVTDYPIEIATIPLTLPKLVKIYTSIKEIIRCSSGHLFSDTKHKCGIHLNINKGKNMKNIHKNLINYIINHPEYFIYSKFKKMCLITDYDEYQKHQETIIGKYVYLNYTKTKLIEIRNIDPEITPHQLECLCADLLFIIHGIDHKIKFEEINFVHILEDLLQKLSINEIKKIKKANKLIIENINENPSLTNYDEDNKK